MKRMLGCAVLFALLLPAGQLLAQIAKPAAKNARPAKAAKELTKPKDGDDFTAHGLFASTAPRPEKIDAVDTTLPLVLEKGTRIALVGNTLFEREQHFGYFETLLYQRLPDRELVVRNLAWSADTPTLQPRPANFADTEQHLLHEKIDVILAAYGYNESFDGADGLPRHRKELTEYLADLKRRACNGKTGPRIVLVAPLANENVTGCRAADRNNERIKVYVDMMKQIAAEQKVGFVDLFEASHEAMADANTDLTINGVHLNDLGYRWFGHALVNKLLSEPGASATGVNEILRQAVLDKNRQYFRRFRPLNTFYYTGDRNQEYGYLDFLPAMRNFDILVSNRDQHIWRLAQGLPTPAVVDDANVPPMPRSVESRAVNEWLPAEEERKAFKMDPRFEVNLFAGEEQFPDIANPIQMRWDSRGRLWVSCSNTYPHVYPGQEPADKLVILEDTNGDGRADKSTIFANNLHVPLSFEFGDGGVYVSEQPYLTFLKDTNGDDRADERTIVLSGFGTEDSHHALHDFIWTPDGDLLFRESIFHHSQVETPYGPVRQQNSGWFRYQPRTHRLTSFGTYPSTNPWGVAFDDWGQHVASHPIYAAAFHALDPPYPQQHAAPTGLRAYSGTCGHQFVDMKSFPDELQGCFIKARYKPTNRVEMHRWVEGEFGYDEEYLGDLLFSTNLSFIPVDIQFGPRGDLFVCDWYNPVKGHAQYSLRDTRRNRESGRIWRITAKGRPLLDPPKFADASIDELLDLLKRPESRYRYWAKQELKQRNALAVRKSLHTWVEKLDPKDARHRHHQIEAAWAYRTIALGQSISSQGIDELEKTLKATDAPWKVWLAGSWYQNLILELLDCADHHARAAAVRLLRDGIISFEGPPQEFYLLRPAGDKNGIVRMEAVIAASYIGTPEALEVVLEAIKHPQAGHLSYAIMCSLNSHTLRKHWENNPHSPIPSYLKLAQKRRPIAEPRATGADRQFDDQTNLRSVDISCVPERMLFTTTHFTATVGQPIKIVFTNPDATDHNLVIVQPGAWETVGMAANAMAKDPKNANSDFIPVEHSDKILQASPMIGPTRKSLVHVLRFTAPTTPGIYPYLCSFPGHWIIMKGEMIVARDQAEADRLLAARKPAIVKEWTLADFPRLTVLSDEITIQKGMQAFVKAKCNACHGLGGHGANLGPDLAESVKKLKGEKLLEQILDPSTDIHEKFRNQQIATSAGRVVTGVVVKEDNDALYVMPNLLAPTLLTKVNKSEIDDRAVSKVSPMPVGLANVLTREEVLELLAFLQSGQTLPDHPK